MQIAFYLFCVMLNLVINNKNVFTEPQEPQKHPTDRKILIASASRIWSNAGKKRIFLNFHSREKKWEGFSCFFLYALRPSKIFENRKANLSYVKSRAEDCRCHIIWYSTFDI